MICLLEYALHTSLSFLLMLFSYKKAPFIRVYGLVYHISNFWKPLQHIMAGVTGFEPVLTVLETEKEMAVIHLLVILFIET
jgi:hypothetical protein